MKSKFDWLLVLMAIVAVMASVAIGMQPGDSIADKIESLRRGCDEYGEAINETTNCFMVVPEGSVLYLETNDYVSLSGSVAYFLMALNATQPESGMLVGPISLEMEMSDGVWVVAPQYWFDCLPDGEVELVDGTVYCHSQPHVRPKTADIVS